jgi:coproporphyrinogen III oxidase-like Fe-S oxidoreductase
VIPIASAQQSKLAAIADIADRPRLSALPPLSVYVHVPWCVRKCPYCDFNSHEQPAVLPEARYLDALQSDLEQALPDIWGRQVHTVFIGGGTPSLLSAEGIDRLLAMLRSHLNLWPDAEITLDSLPAEQLSHMLDALMALRQDILRWNDFATIMSTLESLR